MEKDKRALQFRLVLIYLSILLLGSFWLTLHMSMEPVSMVIEPSVPREGEPIVVTFKLNNSSLKALSISYQFYTNGRLMAEGSATIAGRSCETYQYSYTNPFKMGEQVIFLIRSQSEQGNYERVVSIPVVPPQVWSSFVSFGTLSNTMMSYSLNMNYYYEIFGSDMRWNVGGLVCLLVAVLLVFLELSQRWLVSHTAMVIDRLRWRLSPVSWMLLAITIGIVYTTIITIVVH